MRVRGSWVGRAKLVTGLVVLVSIPACAPGRIFDPGDGVVTGGEGRLSLRKSPFQCYVGPGRIIVGAELPEGKEARLTYWEKGKVETSRSVPFKPHWDAIYHAVPGRLDLNKSYLCVVEVGDRASRPFPMSPGRGPGDQFSFFIIGDTRAGDVLAHRKLIEQMSLREASFYIHTGDYVKDADDPRQWNEFFEIEKPLLEKIPIVPVAGNHDVSEAGIFTGLFFRKERYYSFEYGNALIIVVDSTVPIRRGDRQYLFLGRELDRSRRTDIDHVFLVVHHPPYSSGSHGGEEVLRETIMPLVRQYDDVTAVISGHEHSYERTRPIEGIVHLITGGGGAPLRPVGLGPHTERILVAPHFIEITVEGPSAHLKAIDVYGRVVDEAAIR